MGLQGIPYNPDRRLFVAKAILALTGYSIGAGFLIGGQINGARAASNSKSIESRLNDGLRGNPSAGAYPQPTPAPTQAPVKATPTPKAVPYTLEDFAKNLKKYQAVIPNLAERDLATAVRIAYNEVGIGQLKKAGTKSLHDVLWVMINRIKEKEVFPYADSITAVGLARGQFQPVWQLAWPSGLEPSSLYVDLFEERKSYEILPQKLLGAYIGKLIKIGYKEAEAEALVKEYGETVLIESLKVFAGQIPERLFIEIDGARYGASFFKNPCTSDAANAYWHDRTPRGIWGSGINNRKLWYLGESGDHAFYALVPKNYDEPPRAVGRSC